MNKLSEFRKKILRKTTNSLFSSNQIRVKFFISILVKTLLSQNFWSKMLAIKFCNLLCVIWKIFREHKIKIVGSLENVHFSVKIVNAFVLFHAVFAGVHWCHVIFWQILVLRAFSSFSRKFRVYFTLKKAHFGTLKYRYSLDSNTGIRYWTQYRFSVSVSVFGSPSF